MVRKQSVDSEGAVADRSCSLEKSRKFMKIGEGNLMLKKKKKTSPQIPRMMALSEECCTLTVFAMTCKLRW